MHLTDGNLPFNVANTGRSDLNCSGSLVSEEFGFELRWGWKHKLPRKSAHQKCRKLQTWNVFVVLEIVLLRVLCFGCFPWFVSADINYRFKLDSHSSCSVQVLIFRPVRTFSSDMRSCQEDRIANCLAGVMRHCQHLCHLTIHVT